MKAAWSGLLRADTSGRPERGRPVWTIDVTLPLVAVTMFGAAGATGEGIAAP